MEHNHQRDGGGTRQWYKRSHSTPAFLDCTLKLLLDFVYFYDPRKSIEIKIKRCGMIVDKTTINGGQSLRM